MGELEDDPELGIEEMANLYFQKMYYQEEMLYD